MKFWCCLFFYESNMLEGARFARFSGKNRNHGCTAGKLVSKALAPLKSGLMRTRGSTERFTKQKPSSEPRKQNKAAHRDCVGGREGGGGGVYRSSLSLVLIAAVGGGERTRKRRKGLRYTLHVYYNTVINPSCTLVYGSFPSTLVRCTSRTHRH